MDKLSASRRRKVEERAAVLIAEEMSLRDLRNALTGFGALAAKPVPEARTSSPPPDEAVT